jgi:Fur family peroxide stress response transcriptional regulator
MERAIRYSKKREAILTQIQGTSCHPSAEWVYQQLRPLHPDLSLGTVYRNLAFFRERGLVRSVGVVQGQERFDAITTPHSHFVCNCCGTVLDLPDVRPERGLEQTVSTQYGFAVERCELTFYGLCPNCTDQQNLKEETLS